MNPILNRIDTIFIHVRNLKESVRWYSALIGRTFNENENYDGPIYSIPMGDGRPGLTLDNHCLDEHYEFTPLNQPLFNLSASNIDLAYEYVQKLGADIISEIVRFPDLSEFMIKDPDGNVIMICDCIT